MIQISTTAIVEVEQALVDLRRMAADAVAEIDAPGQVVGMP